MTSGQTVLSLTDLPFAYSFVNLLVLIIFGLPENYEGRLILIGLIAGIAGTFLVYLHPIQWFLDKKMNKIFDEVSIIHFKDPTKRPKGYDIEIHKNQYQLALKSSSIKYLKDKFASQIYFTIIVWTFSMSFAVKNMRDLLGINEPTLIVPVAVILGIMGGGVFVMCLRVFKQIKKSLRLESVFNQVIRWAGNPEEKEEIRRSIEYQEWEIVDDKTTFWMKRHWGNLDAYGKRVY